MNNPYAPPSAKVGDIDDQKTEDFDYAGFWWRVLAAIIDSILFIIVRATLDHGGRFRQLRELELIAR